MRLKLAPVLNWGVPDVPVFVALVELTLRAAGRIAKLSVAGPEFEQHGAWISKRRIDLRQRRSHDPRGEPIPRLAHALQMVEQRRIAPTDRWCLIIKEVGHACTFYRLAYLRAAAGISNTVYGCNIST